VRLYQALDRYQTRLFAYIYRIATNLAIGELRRRKRRRIVSFQFLSIADRTGIDAIPFDPPDAQPLQDDALIERERQRMIKSAIATL